MKEGGKDSAVSTGDSGVSMITPNHDSVMSIPLRHGVTHKKFIFTDFGRGGISQKVVDWPTVSIL
jgi:hypothetical protein